MQQGSKRLFSMVVTLICVVAAFVIFFQFIRPAYMEAQEVRAEIIARENLLETQSAAIAEVRTLIEQYRTDTALQQTVSQVIPSRPEVGGALYQLSAIGEQYDITFLSTSANTPQLSLANSKTASSTVGTVRPLGIATFQVRFTSTYDNLQEFLSRVQSNVRLMDVTGIAIAPTSSGGGLLTVDLTVATYYQAQD